MKGAQCFGVLFAIFAYYANAATLRGDSYLKSNDTSICSALSKPAGSTEGSCRLTDTTLDSLSPLEIAQVWIEATNGMAGAYHGNVGGGKESCVAAVSVALGECNKVGALTPATYNGINTKICSISGSKSAGLWQVTSSDTDDVATSGCSSSEQLAACTDAGCDPCMNARLAYAHAQLKCTATSYDANSCSINGTAYTNDIPQCTDLAEVDRNMPCYFGPFCLNAQLDSANAPYSPPTPEIDECFPGIDTCKRPQYGWGGWGANWDFYTNTFCCLDASCGSGDSSVTNWNCFNHGQTELAYACPVTNPLNLQGKPGVDQMSTQSYIQLAEEACAAFM